MKPIGYALLAVGISLPIGGDAKTGTREVWMRHQDLYAQPYSFSRRVARVPRGTLLEILDERAPWSRVRVAVRVPQGEAPAKGSREAEPAGLEGWTVWREPPRLARLPGGLSPEPPSPASVALAVKAFETISGEIAELLPQADRAFAEIRDSYLELEELEEFARAGGLRGVGKGGSR